MDLGSFTIDFSMVVGFVLLIATFAIFHILVIFSIKKLWPDTESPKEKEKALAIANRLIKWVYPAGALLFIIVILWTGVRPTPTGENKAGIIDTEPAGELQYSEPLNRPDIKTKELKEQAEELQKDSMDKLQDFRKDIFANENVITPNVESEINDEPNKSN